MLCFFNYVHDFSDCWQIVNQVKVLKRVCVTNDQFEGKFFIVQTCLSIKSLYQNTQDGSKMDPANDREVAQRKKSGLEREREREREVRRRVRLHGRRKQKKQSTSFFQQYRSLNHTAAQWSENTNDRQQLMQHFTSVFEAVNHIVSLVYLMCNVYFCHRRHEKLHIMSYRQWSQMPFRIHTVPVGIVHRKILT